MVGLIYSRDDLHKDYTTVGLIDIVGLIGSRDDLH